MPSPRVSNLGTHSVDLHGKGEWAHSPPQCHSCLSRGSLLKVAYALRCVASCLQTHCKASGQFEHPVPVPGQKCGAQYVACRTNNTEMGLISVMIFFTLLYFVLCAPSLAAFSASHCSSHVVAVDAALETVCIKHILSCPVLKSILEC